jgi:hypothetical protein
MRVEFDQVKATTRGCVNRKEKNQIWTVLFDWNERAPIAGEGRLLHLETHAVVDLSGRSEQKNCQARARERERERASDSTAARQRALPRSLGG